MLSIKKWWNLIPGDIIHDEQDEILKILKIVNKNNHNIEIEYENVGRRSFGIVKTNVNAKFKVEV